MRANVVDPDDLKANWSLKDKWLCIVDNRIKVASHQSFSNARDNTEIMEMSLKSAGACGQGILLMGIIQAVFHCSGTTPIERDLLRR